MESLNPASLFGISGMVVAITGGGTGIGLMMTRAFVAGGAAKVYIVGRRREKLEEAAKIAPDTIIPIVGDVTSKESLVSVAAHIQKDAGYLNLLICNSGTMPPPLGIKSTEVDVKDFAKKAFEQKPEDWEQTFATNSTAIAFTAFAMLELLDAGNKQGNCAGRSSQILVTSSIAGYSRVGAFFGAYAASKAAATHMVKQLAGTLVPYSIRVNGLAPGLFPSDLAAGVIAGGGAKKDDPTVVGAFEKTFIPAERLGKTEDMAGTVLYLASAAGAYLNGNITVQDGGRLAQLPSSY